MSNLFISNLRSDFTTESSGLFWLIRFRRQFRRSEGLCIHFSQRELLFLNLYHIAREKNSIPTLWKKALGKTATSLTFSYVQLHRQLMC